MDLSSELPEIIPVFPLPDTALFPHSLAPLHIFEPRYRSMVCDALGGARTVAIAMLRDGFEPLYYTRHAPIYRVVGIGQIVASERLDDGRYYILLHGISRGEVLQDLNDKPYRRARVRPLISYCTADRAETQRFRERMRRLVRRCSMVDRESRRTWLKLIAARAELDQITDAVAAGLAMPAAMRQSLMKELDASVRAAALIEQLKTTARIHAVTRRQHQRHVEQDWNLN